MQYQQRLDDIERRFDELNAQMADPAVIRDAAQYRKITKAHSELADIVAKYREWKAASGNLHDLLRAAADRRFHAAVSGAYRDAALHRRHQL